MRTSRVAVKVPGAADALVFFGLRGASPVRIFQSIAAGLLGRAAFSGGLATAALGVALHFFIAFGIVGVFLPHFFLAWFMGLACIS